MEKPKLMVPPRVAKASMSVSSAGAGYHPLNIVFDTGNIDSASVSQGHKNFYKNLLLPRLASWTASFLQVSGSTALNAFPHDFCGSDFPVANKYDQALFPGDLLIIAKAENNSKVNYVAQASACLLATGDNRPIVGFIQFNTYYMALDEQAFDRHVRVSMHELLHVLALSPQLFPYYSGYGSPASVFYTAQNRSYLKTPSVLGFARQHLNCPSLAGVPLEDEGGAGSAGAHFEKAVFGEEIMTSQVSAEMTLSGLTLGLLQDSGWYLVATAAQEQLWWGKNAGCSFFTNLCSGSFPEFCAVSGEVSCTADYRSGTSCSANTFSNSCYIRRILNDYMCDQIYADTKMLPAGYEAKGATSRCFDVAGSGARSFGCFPSVCNADGTLTLTVKGGSLTCASTGQVLATGGFSITCPDLPRFCGFRAVNKCATDCAGHGYCQSSGQCTCRYGYSGSDCASVELCSVKPSELCASIFNASTTAQPSHARTLTVFLLLFALLAA